MRRPLVVLLALLVVLGGLSWVLWFWTIGRIAAGLAEWQAAATAQGWAVRAGAATRAGWPFAADLVLHDVTLAATPDLLPGGAGWSAGQVVLHLSPLAPELLEVRLEGTQRLHGGFSSEIPFTSGHLTLTVPLRGAGPVQIDAAQISFAAPLAGMTVGLLTGQVQPGATLGFEIAAEAIALPPPPAPQPALGGRIASATVAGALAGTLPPPSADVAARLAAWQRSGGRLLVRHLAIGWGPLGLTGTATLGLDDALQPEGTGSVRVVGYAAALGALAAGGVLTPAAAQAIRAVLTLLARTPEGGGAPEVALPLALHTRLLRAGAIPLGRLPAIDWTAVP